VGGVGTDCADTGKSHHPTHCYEHEHEYGYEYEYDYYNDYYGRQEDCPVITE
jgi:hypothetical protein